MKTTKPLSCFMRMAIGCLTVYIHVSVLGYTVLSPCGGVKQREKYKLCKCRSHAVSCKSRHLIAFQVFAYVPYDPILQPM